MDSHVAIVAAVMLIAPLSAQAQQRYDGQPPASERTPPPPFRDRFAAANITGDGCLTLEQAQRGLPVIARQFSQIDVKGRGCVTLAELGSFRRAQNAQAVSKRFAAANTTNDGCLTRSQAEHRLPVVARQFSQIDVEMRGCVTLAEVTDFLHSRNARQQPQPAQPRTPAPETAAPAKLSQPLSFSDRFADANTTNDGCLTLEQARQGLPEVAKDFAHIDTQGRGCVTAAGIRAFWHAHAAKRQEDQVALPKDTPPPPAGY